MWMWIIANFLLSSFLAPSLLSLVLTLKSRELEGIRSNETSNIYELTQQELQAIEEFRPMVRDVLNRTYESSKQFLLPWIRGSNFNLKSAEGKLREAQQWKKDIRWDELDQEPVPSYLKRPLCQFDGVDKENNPVFYVKMEDIRKALIHGHKPSLTRHVYQCFSRLTVLLNELSVKTGKVNLGGFLIGDASGYNIKEQSCYQCVVFYMEMLADFQKYLPEHMKYMVGVNCPTVFKPLVDMMKPLMSPVMRKGLRAFGFDKGEYTPFLLDRISPDNLNVLYGGTRTSVL